MNSRILRAIACAGLLGVPGVTDAQDLTREAVQAAYSRVRTLTAEIEQTKSSSYLFKPLVSRIHMEYGDGRVLWRVLEPVRAELVLENDRISTDPSTPLPPGAAERMAPLIRLIRAVISVDFAVLAKDFDLVFSASSMEATPRSGSELSLVKRLVFRFNPDLSLATVAVETGDETTELKFLHFEASPKVTP